MLTVINPNHIPGAIKMKVSLNSVSFSDDEAGPTVGMYCISHKICLDTCARDKKGRTTGLVKLGVAHSEK